MRRPSVILSLLRLRIVISFCLTLVVFCSLIATGETAENGQILAVESEDLNSQIREVPVTSEELRGKLDHGWQVLPFEDYQKLRESAKSKPRNTWIRLAEYSAILSGETLRGGVLTAEIQQARAHKELLLLTPMNLVVSELNWGQQKAIWGTTEKGRAALLVDGSQSRLQGKWTLKGRQLARSVQFDVRVAPATVSRMKLLLPENQILTTSVGSVSVSDPSETQGWNEWLVELGSHTECRLVITSRNDSSPSHPLILAETETSYIVRQDRLLVQTRVNSETFATPATQLDFLVPRGVEVEDVLFGTLPVQFQMDGTDRRLVVKLPDPVLGRSRPLHIRAFAPLKQQVRKWDLPQLKLLNSVFINGKMDLTVESPLELRSFEAIGMRQTETVSDVAQKETFTFHQFRSDARLSVDLGQPPLELSSRILTYLNVGAKQWSLESEISWNAVSGSTYVTEYVVSQDWGITEVGVGSSTSFFSSEVNWSVRENQDGRRILEVEVPESLDSDHPITVQIKAQRTVNRSDLSLGLPVITPTKCRIVEQCLAVAHPTTFTAESSSLKSFMRITDDEVSAEIRKMVLWNEILPELDSQLILLTPQDSQKAVLLRFRSRKSPVKSDVSVNVSLDESRVTEEYLVKITPLFSSVDRVLVFVTSNSDSPKYERSLNWELVDRDNRSLKLQVVQLSRSQHEAEKLLAGEEGELWEIRLPVPLRQSFEIRASRTGSYDSSFSPSLVMVRGSGEFLGVVTLSTPENVRVDVQMHGVTAVSGEETSETPLSNMTGPAFQVNQRLWRYDAASDRLTLQINKEGVSAPLHKTASLKLRSLIFPRNHGFDIHFATFFLKDDVRDGQFEFSFPSSAILHSVILNGDKVTVDRDEGRYVLSSVPGHTANVIEIQYRSPSSGGEIWSEKEIVVPGTSYDVLSFDWDFALPPDIQLVAEPDSTVLFNSLYEPTWGERLFGPLGRSNPGRFDSFWKISSDGKRASAVEPFVEGKRWVPADWVSYHASGLFLPKKMVLKTWSVSKGRLLGWITLLMSLFGGVILRRFEIVHREKIGLVWICLSVMAACLAPSVMAGVFGGACAGSLIALLLPKQIVSGRLIKFHNDASEVLGSTITYQHVPATVLLICIGVLIAQSQAQTASQDPKQASGQLTKQLSNTDDYTVYLLKSAEKSDADAPRYVYLRKTLLERLTREERKRLPSTDYLIMSAQYQGTINQQNLATIDAHFSIAALSADRVTRIRLPISQANPSGSDACIVNGKRQPLLLNPDGNGFLVELPKSRDYPVEARRPLTGKSNFIEASPTLDRSLAIYRVSLHLHPPTTTEMNGGRFQMGIPSVNDSSLFIQHDDADSLVQISRARGETVQTEGSRGSAVRLGGAPLFEVMWSSGDVPVEVSAEYEAKVACLVKILPTHLEYRFRVAYDIVSGSVDFITWNLPRGMVVRSIDSKYLQERYTSPSGKRSSQLLMEFSTPQQNHIVVDAEMLLPIQSEGGEVTLPVIDLFQGDPKSLLTAYQLGVSTSSGFQITPKMTVEDNAATLSPEIFSTFLSGGEESQSLGKAQYAYKIGGAAEFLFEIQPVTAHRKIRNAHQIGYIRKSRIDWVLTAEVEVTTPSAPVFMHQLQIDPRLKIDSIVVQEDDVDRLVRRSRTQDSVTLFLSEKTAGVQNLTFRGSMPLALSEKMVIPMIHVKDAELEEITLQLFREREIDVELLEKQKYAQVVVSEPEAGENSSDLFVGSYLLSDASVAPSIRTALNTKRDVYDKASILTRQSEGSWGLVTLFRLPGGSHVGARTVLHVPGSLSENLHVESPDVEQLRNVLRDGSVEITLQSSGVEPDGKTIVVSSTIDSSPDEIWRLPEIQISGVAVRENYLVLSPADLYLPTDNKTIAELDRTALPLWLRGDKTSEYLASRGKVYQSETATWQLVKRLKSSQQSVARVPLIQSWIHHDSPDRVSGTTEIMFLSKSRNQIEFDWPTALKMRALLVNGAVISTQSDVEKQLVVPVDSAAEMHFIQIFWSRDTGKTLRWFGDFSSALPNPENVEVSRSLITVVPEENARILTTSGIAGLTPQHLSLMRLEGLLESVQQESADDSNREYVWNSIDHFQSRFARRFQKADSIDQNSGNGVPLDRFDSIAKEVENESRASGHTVDDKDFIRNRHLLRSFGLNANAESSENRSLVSGSLPIGSGTRTISYWIVSEWIMNMIRGVCGFVLALVLLRRVPLLKIGEWMGSHPLVAWTLFSLLWLFCFRPAGIGLLMLILLSIPLVRRLRQKISVPPVEQPAV